jgi:predicted amidophosphoribosyltransferase
MNERCDDCGRPLHLDDVPPLCPECRRAIALEIEEFVLVLEDDGQ